MCGICGIFQFNGQFKGESPLDPRDLTRRMMSLIAHRGPDEEGIYLDQSGAVCLGHRRLSIIDLANGKQPMTSLAGHSHIVFNGEIYNYPELKKELQARGKVFNTNSDTEVILNLYEAEGARAFQRLNGIFAFALYDSRRRELILARDHFGIKPLYYWMDEGKLLFGSELKAILQDSDVPRRVDYEAFNSFFTFRYNPSPQTLLEGIKKLYPGHFLIIDAQGRARVESFWDYRPETNSRISEAEAIEQYQNLLEQAVARQMISDVPVGLMLSGGIDSALLGLLMQRGSADQIKTFTIGFPGRGSYNELEEAKVSARLIGSEHHDLVIDREEYLSFFIESFYYTEEPIAEATIPALYYVSRLAAKHLKVVLAGQGADEPLAGYHRYIGERYLSHLSPLFNSPPVRAAAALLPRNERLKRAVYASQFASESERFLAIYTIFTPQLKQRLFNDETRVAMRNVDQQIINRLADQATGLQDSLSRMLYVDTRLSLADNLLLFGDKMTMANSLEMRVPFLDVELVKFLESLPVSLKLKGLTRKYIHKKASAKWLPREIIYRKKRGFETPVDEWLQGDFAGNARALFNQPGSACRNYFNLEEINRLIDLHRARRENYLRHILILLSFELWHKRFIEGKSPDHELLIRGKKKTVAPVSDNRPRIMSVYKQQHNRQGNYICGRPMEAWA